jgi:hypothetical protein
MRLKTVAFREETYYRGRSPRPVECAQIPNLKGDFGQALREVFFAVHPSRVFPGAPLPFFSWVVDLGADFSV